MPQYCWRCDKCEAETIVVRSMSSIDVPPDDGCDKCKSTELKRVIVPPESGVKGFILVDSGIGWAAHGYYSKPYTPKKDRGY